MIEKWLDDCFEVSLKLQGRDVGQRNSVLVELIDPFPNQTVVGTVRVGSRNNSFLGGGISKVSRGFSGGSSRGKCWNQTEFQSIDLDVFFFVRSLDELTNVYIW